MTRLTSKIAIPIILVGIFVSTIFVSISYQNISLGFYIVLLLLFVFVFFFGFSIGQSFTAPIKKLLDRATDLSNGDLKARAYLETRDEISELARVFNEIADNLEKSKSQTESAEKATDIKVRARTQELKETIDALEQKVRNRTIEYERIMGEVQKLQQNAKGNEMETEELKKQLNGLRSTVKLPSSKKSKTKSEGA
jgi:methyl-accepting chemotaxis protein